MILKPLGRTGLNVSAISLGTVELGMDYGLPGSSARPSTADAEKLIHHALDSGINHLDTARAYGDSETIIGAALGPRRRDVIITSKVVIKDDLQALTASVETSLAQLRTDYLDVLMLHTPPTDEAVDHLLRLKDRGWYRHLGASVYGNGAAISAIHAGVFDCLQIAFSPLDRRPETDLFALAEQANVGIVARSVLLKGALTPRYRDLSPAFADLQATVARLDAIGIPLPELGYRYVLGETRLATALVGTAHIHELDEILRYAELGPLPSEIRARIRQEPLLPEQWLNPGLWPSG